MNSISRAQERVPRPAGIGGLTLSSLQRAYFLGRNAAFPMHCRAHYCLEFSTAALVPARLEEALHRLTRRHEALRTCVDRNGALRVLAQAPGRIEVQVSRTSPGESELAVLDGLRASFERREAPESGWPLLEVHAVRLASEWRVLFGFDLMIVDGPAIDALLRELALLYDGKPVPEGATSIALPPAPPGRVARARAHWQDRLAELELGPELPVFWENVEGAPAHFRRRQLTLEAARWTAFCSRCEAERVSPAAATLTAFLLVLKRWSRRGQFAVSVMTDFRQSRSPASDAVGNFSSTVIVRTPVNTAGTFADRARAVARELMNALLYADFPGIDVAQALRRQREAAPQIPFPIAFVAALDARPEPTTELPLGMETSGVTWTALSTPQVLLDHQVMRRTDGSVQLYWDAVEASFPPGVVEDMWTAYSALVVRLTESVQCWTSEASVPLPRAHAEARARSNSTAQRWAPALLHEGFWRQVGERGGALALETQSESFTYSELAAVVSGLARELNTLGVEPASLVAINMVKGWEQVAAALAVLSVGAAYVPIDAQLPEERRNWLMERCSIRIALVQQGHRAEQGWPAGVHRLEVSRERAGDGMRPSASVSPDQLAYVIFTSGSTGHPKGVAIRHSAATNTLRDINQRFGITAADRVFGASSFSFDLSVYDAFGVLAVGGTLVLPAAGPLDPEAWLHLIVAAGVTVWNSVPAIMQALVDCAEQRNARLGDGLRVAMLSGDWIPVDLPRRIAARAPGVLVFSLGGATEASVWSIFHEVQPDRIYHRSIPYGRALTNQTMHVLDQDLDECPDWVTGEIYIGGVGLADGYWQDAARTSASFITHPRTGERLYRTGDLGRWLGAEIEFLGREDFQVKIRGYRVELNEIEAVLERHAEVAAAVVVAPGDPRKGRRLVAHVAKTTGSELDAATLLEHLRQALPEYMVPAQLHFHEALPLTANGKVDRGSLVKRSESIAHGVDERREPASVTEVLLLRIWQELLDHEALGMDDDFFSVGGDSFLAVLMTTRIADQIGVRLPVTALLRQPTISGMARAIDDWRTKRASPAQANSVVVLHEGPGIPLYLIHAAGGEVLCFRELAATLGNRFVAALPATSDPTGNSSVEEMAARYLDVIRAHSPTEAFHLGGWSFGGVVAYEMSRQLGERQRLCLPLLLIDTPVPLRAPELSERDVWQWFVRDLAGSWCGNADLGQPANVEELVAELRKHRVLSQSDLEPQVSHSYAIFARNLRALARYQPVPHSVRLVQYRAQELTVPELQRHPAAGDSAWGWNALVSGDLEVIEIPGDHHSMMTAPHVHKLGTAILRVLDEHHIRP